MVRQSVFDKLAKQHHALRFDFAITELELALTFYKIATSTSDPEKANRNAENARAARNTARKALSDTILSNSEREEVDLRLNRLKELSEIA